VKAVGEMPAKCDKTLHGIFIEALALWDCESQRSCGIGVGMKFKRIKAEGETK